MISVIICDYKDICETFLKRNVSSYGGDPDNVTIFGGSAGSWSVEALLCSNLSTGLFHKAIGQSGCLKGFLI